MGEVEGLDAVAALGFEINERPLGNDRLGAAHVQIQIRRAALQRDLQRAIGLVLVLPELAMEVDPRVDPLVAGAPDGVGDQFVEVPLPVPDLGIDGYCVLDDIAGDGFVQIRLDCRRPALRAVDSEISELQVRDPFVLSIHALDPHPNPAARIVSRVVEPGSAAECDGRHHQGDDQPRRKQESPTQPSFVSVSVLSVRNPAASIG